MEDLIKQLLNLSPEQKEAVKVLLGLDGQPIKKEKISPVSTSPQKINKGGRKQTRREKTPREISEGKIPKGKGSQCHKSNIQTGKRPNLWEQDKDFNSHKEDTEIDKLLWKKKKATTRDREGLIESTCKVCGQVEAISVLLAMKEDGKITHTCNDCIKR